MADDLHCIECGGVDIHPLDCSLLLVEASLYEVGVPADQWPEAHAAWLARESGEPT